MPTPQDFAAAFRTAASQPPPGPQSPLEVGPIQEIESGNVDLYRQPKVRQPDGKVSTVYSMSFGEDGKEILVPRVSRDAILSPEQAIAQYKLTGKHLGKFKSVHDANAYAEQLHREYESGKYDVPPDALAAAAWKAKQPTWGQWAVSTGARVLPAVAGGVIGSLAAPGAGTYAGATIGGSVGGALGSLVGETGAELYEKREGLRDELNPKQIATQTALGAIPFVGKPATVARAVVGGAAQGAVHGAIGAAATHYAETGEMPSAKDIGIGTAFGTIFGGAGAAAFHAGGEWYRGRRAAQAGAQPSAPPPPGPQATPPPAPGPQPRPGYQLPPGPTQPGAAPPPPPRPSAGPSGAAPRPPEVFPEFVINGRRVASIEYGEKGARHTIQFEDGGKAQASTDTLNQLLGDLNRRRERWAFRGGDAHRFPVQTAFTLDGKPVKAIVRDPSNRLHGVEYQDGTRGVIAHDKLGQAVVAQAQKPAAGPQAAPEGPPPPSGQEDLFTAPPPTPAAAPRGAPRGAPRRTPRAPVTPTAEPPPPTAPAAAPPPTPTPAPAPAVEPWTLTQSEFRATLPSRPELADVQHRYAVDQALKQGKAVPPHVLQDYPDLAAPEPTVPPERGLPPSSAVVPEFRKGAKRLGRIRETMPQQIPSDHMTQVERLELAKMLVAMESSEFTPKRFIERTRQGGTLDVEGGAAGHPVYWDIVGIASGDIEHNPKPIHSGYTRGDVENQLRKFFATGERNLISDLAIEQLRENGTHSAADVPADYASKYTDVPPEVAAREATRFQRPPEEPPEGPPPPMGEEGATPEGAAPDVSADAVRTEVAGMTDEELEGWIALMGSQEAPPPHVQEILDIAHAERARRQTAAPPTAAPPGAPPEGPTPPGRGSLGGGAQAGEPTIGSRVRFKSGNKTIEGEVRDVITAGKPGGKGIHRERRRVFVRVTPKRSNAYETFVDLDKLEPTTGEVPTEGPPPPAAGAGPEPPNAKIKSWADTLGVYLGEHNGVHYFLGTGKTYGGYTYQTEGKGGGVTGGPGIENWDKTPVGKALGPLPNVEAPPAAAAAPPGLQVGTKVTIDVGTYKNPRSVEGTVIKLITGKGGKPTGVRVEYTGKAGGRVTTSRPLDAVKPTTTEGPPEFSGTAEPPDIAEDRRRKAGLGEGQPPLDFGGEGTTGEAAAEPTSRQQLIAELQALNKEIGAYAPGAFDNVRDDVPDGQLRGFLEHLKDLKSLNSRQEGVTEAGKDKQVHRNLMDRMSGLTDEEIRQLDAVDDFGNPLSPGDLGLDLPEGPAPPTESELRGAKASQRNEARRRQEQAPLLEAGGVLPEPPSVEDVVARRRAITEQAKEGHAQLDEKFQTRIEAYKAALRERGVPEDEIERAAVGHRSRPQTPAYIADGLWQKLREVDPSINRDEFLRQLEVPEGPRRLDWRRGDDEVEALPPEPSEAEARKEALHDRVIALDSELGHPFGDRDDFSALLDTATEDLTDADLQSALDDLERVRQARLPAAQRIAAEAGAAPEGPPVPGDVLETGEVQPRLPGAEDVREQNIQTPEFEAPFSLTSEVGKPKKAPPPSLFSRFLTDEEGTWYPFGRPQEDVTLPGNDILDAARAKEKPGPTLRERLSETSTNIIRDYYDRFVDVKRATDDVRAAMAARGQVMRPEEDAGVILDLVAGGTAGPIEAAKLDIQDIRTAARKAGVLPLVGRILDNAAWIRAWDIIDEKALDAFARGDFQKAAEYRQKQVSKLVVPLHKDRADLMADLSALQAHPRYAEARAYADQLFDLNRQAWDLAHTPGRYGESLISDGIYNQSLARGRDYVPLERILDMVDEDPNWTGGAALDLKQRRFLQRLEGSELETRDPWEASLLHQARVIKEVNRNEAAASLIHLGTLDPQGIGRDIRPLPPGQPLPHGYERITYYRNGEKQHYMVPTELGNAMRLAGPVNTMIVGQTALQASANVLRAGAVGMNVGFAVANVPRDIGAVRNLSNVVDSYSLNPRQFGQALADRWGTLTKTWVDSLYHTITKDQVYRDVLRARVLHGTLSRQLQPLDLKFSPESWRDLPLHLLKQGLKLPGEISRVSEETTKVASHRMLRQKGATPIAAAIEARRYGGTPDVASKGNKTDISNLLFMFSHVAAKGVGRMFKRVRENPRTALTMLTSATALGLTQYEWNSQFVDDDGVPAIDKVPRDEMENNWVLVMPWKYTTSQGEHRYTTWRVPKSPEIQSLANPIQKTIALATGSQTAESPADIAAGAVTGLSPIRIRLERGDVGNLFRWQPGDMARSLGYSFLSQTNPAIGLPFELGMNVDPYRRVPLVPQREAEVSGAEQYGPTTSPTAVAIGKATGFSPRLIEYAIRRQGGGVGESITTVSDMLLRSDEVRQRLNQTELEGPEYLSRLPGAGPVLRRFQGSTGNQLTRDIEQDFFKLLADSREVTRTANYMDQRGYDRESYLGADPRRQALLDLAGDIEATNKVLTDLRNEMRGVQNDSNLSPQERQQQMLALRSQYNDQLREVYFQNAIVNGVDEPVEQPPAQGWGLGAMPPPAPVPPISLPR